MHSIVEPQVTESQAPQVLGLLTNLRFVSIQDVRKGFAARLHEICDDQGIPAERGRQTRLGEIFKVTPNAARKWLKGSGMPSLDVVVDIANWAGVNVNWLLQGTGLKKGDRVSTRDIVLGEVLSTLPPERRHSVLDQIRYQLERAGPKIVSEKMARYEHMLAAFEREGKRKN